MDKVSASVYDKIEADGTQNPNERPGGSFFKTNRFVFGAENPEVQKNHQRNEDQERNKKQEFVAHEENWFGWRFDCRTKKYGFSLIEGSI